MMLEFASNPELVSGSESYYPSKMLNQSAKGGQHLIVIDWQPMIISIINDLRNDINPSTISSKFHNTLANFILEITKKSGLNKVVLSGGCFQNALLTELTVNLLRENSYQVYWHQRIPPNDGGIALGQIAASLMKNNSSNEIEKEKQLTKEIG